MAFSDWKQLEDHVRLVAQTRWSSAATPERIAGANYDCVLKPEPDRWIVVEVTRNHELDKVRGDINRHFLMRNTKFGDQVFVQCYIVLNFAPTAGMRDAGKASNVNVLSVDEFTREFFDFSAYQYVRSMRPFGSAFDPETGTPARSRYLNAPFLDVSTEQDIRIDDIVSSLLDRKRVVLLGEYGTGKSRAIQEIFAALSTKSSDTFLYPIAIDLRHHWGLRTADEVIRRHLSSLGMSPTADRILRGLNTDAFCFLLDGFDEIGSQSWSTSPDLLQRVRKEALAGVADLMRSSRAPALIAGREHYFNSDQQMFEALGVDPSTTKVVRCHPEWKPELMEEFIDGLTTSVDMPPWLPRRPLVAQMLSAVEDRSALEDLLSDQRGEAAFWESFISTVCKRETLIRHSMDPAAVRLILRRLARVARTKPEPTGPITATEINSAFEDELGAPPTGETSNILLRLPGLGRVDSGDTERRFADLYVLDGLRADNLVAYASDPVLAKSVSVERWTHAMQPNGHRVAGTMLNDRELVDKAVQAAKIASQGGNATLAGDFVAAILSSADDSEVIDFRGLSVVGAVVSALDLQETQVTGLTIASSWLDALYLPPADFRAPTLSNCIVIALYGASSAVGIPAWMHDCEIGQYEEVATSTQIRAANLSGAHKILATIVKKTFFQRGRARKATALVRGLGALDTGGLVKKVIKTAISHGVIDTHEATEGLRYKPVREHTKRMAKMLGELNRSEDPLWIAVGRL